MIDERYDDDDFIAPVKPVLDDESENESDAGESINDSDSDVEADAAIKEPAIFNQDTDDDDDDDDDEDDDDDYLQKFDESLRSNIIADHHPELHQHNYEEIDALSNLTKNEFGVVMDPLHKTLPFLTKYERARVLGERAKQINGGAKPFIKVDPTMIDGYLIALKELEQKMIPFIVKRPLPHGGCEYWKLKDLELL
jgi:DNA-directed RNA polymerase I, II, and III subunit RPABC2